MEGDGVHTLILIQQQITRKHITFEMVSYTCLELLTMWWQIDSFFRELMMSVVELGLLIDVNMYFFLPDDQQIANEGWFCRSESKK